MEAAHYIMTYLKFGRESDLSDLLNNGTIYMNPIQKFKETEDGFLRGDKYEGVVQIRNLPAGQFEIESLGIKGNYLSLHIRESYEKTLGNIYSMYCISSIGFPDKNNIQIDKRVKEFGSHFLMITDCRKFQERLLDGLNKTGLKHYSDFVTYYDKNNISETLTVYHKPDDFEYQKEYRLYVERDEISPYSFQIGSIKDIAVVLPIDKIDEPILTI